MALADECRRTSQLWPQRKRTSERGSGRWYQSPGEVYQSRHPIGHSGVHARAAEGLADTQGNELVMVLANKPANEPADEPALAPTGGLKRARWLYYARGIPEGI